MGRDGRCEVKDSFTGLAYRRIGDLYMGRPTYLRKTGRVRESR